MIIHVVVGSEIPGSHTLYMNVQLHMIVKLRTLPGSGNWPEMPLDPDVELGLASGSESDADPEPEWYEDELTADSEIEDLLAGTDDGGIPEPAETAPVRKSDLEDQAIELDPEQLVPDPDQVGAPEPGPDRGVTVPEPPATRRSTRAAAEVAAGRITDRFKQRRA